MELQSLFVAIYLVAIYAAFAGVVAAALFYVLRLFKKKPSFAAVFIGCGIALWLSTTLATSVALLLPAMRAGLDRSEQAADRPLSHPAKTAH
jgi:hypothetical protein